MERPEITSTDGTSEMTSTTKAEVAPGRFACPRLQSGYTAPHRVPAPSPSVLNWRTAKQYATASQAAAVPAAAAPNSAWRPSSPTWSDGWTSVPSYGRRCSSASCLRDTGTPARTPACGVGWSSCDRATRASPRSASSPSWRSWAFLNGGSPLRHRPDPADDTRPRARPYGLRRRPAGRRQVVAGIVEALAGPPRHTRGRRQRDLLDRSPPTVAVDGLGLVEAVDRLGDCVVVAVPGLPTELTASASASRSV